MKIISKARMNQLNKEYNRLLVIEREHKAMVADYEAKFAKMKEFEKMSSMITSELQRLREIDEKQPEIAEQMRAYLNIVKAVISAKDLYDRTEWMGTTRQTVFTTTVLTAVVCEKAHGATGAINALIEEMKREKE